MNNVQELEVHINEPKKETKPKETKEVKKEKVVSITGTVDPKTVAIIMLTFILVMILFGYNMRNVEVQNAIEQIQRSNAQIQKYENGIKTEKVKIGKQNEILKKNKIQFNP